MRMIQRFDHHDRRLRRFYNQPSGHPFRGVLPIRLLTSVIIVAAISLLIWMPSTQAQTTVAENPESTIAGGAAATATGEGASGETGPWVPSGFSGGITSNDFQPLMDLIQSVIDTDSWQDGGGEGAIIDYPAGVFADAASAVAAAATNPKISGLSDQTGALDPSTNIRSRARVDDQSTLRTISLNRIQSAIAAAANTGQPIDSSLENLAGIYRVDFVFIDSQNDDILIAGPAGQWRKNTSGRNVNVETGRPTLQLDDLMVCLQNAFHSGGKFGCTIIPKPAALVAAQKFIGSTSAAPNSRKWRQSLQSKVGKQDIVVHGVSPESKVANTIVTADCLMKRIGMGLEPSIDQVPDYFQRVKKNADAGDGQTLIRWWFTMAYDSLTKDAGGRAFKISNNSVKVLSENELLSDQGQRIHTGTSDDATAGFAADFSQHYDTLSKKHPVLASLKNVFDLALVANIVYQHDVENRHRWRSHFSFPRHQPDEDADNDTRYRLVSLSYDTEVDSIMNFENVYFRKQGRRFRKTIVGVSGGVEFDFSQLLKSTKQVQRSRSEFPAAFFDVRSRKVVAAASGKPQVSGPWWWD